MAVMRIKSMREAAGMSQVALAEKMGVLQGTVSNWETEFALPRAKDIPRLATVLACSIGELFVTDD